MSRELQAGHPGLNSQEKNGKSKHFCIHEGQKGSLGYSTWIHNGEMMFDLPEGRVQRAFFSSAQWQDQRQWAKREILSLSEHPEALYHCQADWALAQAAQGGCHHLWRYSGPGQLSLGGPA